MLSADPRRRSHLCSRCMERRLRRGIDRFPGWLQRLVEIGSEPSDSEELRVRKAVLVLSASLMASLSFVWVITYASLGLWVPAAIPFVYQLASATSIYAFARTRRYAMFRESQLLMSLVFPFLLQWSLGGFEVSSAVCLWGITSPLGALLFVGARQSVPWFVAFAGLVGFSAAIDPALSDGASEIPNGVVIIFFALNIIGVATTAYALLQYFVRARERRFRSSRRSIRRSSSSRPSPSACCSTCCPSRSPRASRSGDGHHRRRLPGGDRAVRRPGRIHAAVGAPFRRGARLSARPGVCALGCAREPNTASRRSRRSETRTWLPAGFRSRGTITPRRSPAWPWRWDRR